MYYNEGVNMESRSEVIHVRVKPRLRDMIRAEALETDLSESQIIREVLVKHYESRS